MTGLTAAVVFLTGATAGWFITWAKTLVNSNRCPRCAIEDARTDALREFNTVGQTTSDQMWQAAQRATNVRGSS